MVDESCLGHRSRLRERFARGGIDALHDYEVLELLLTYVIARRDTKAIARRMLKELGSLNAVLSAPAERLAAIEGAGEASANLIRFVHAVASRGLREDVDSRPVITDRTSVEKFLRFEIGSRTQEHVAVLYLDSGGKVISAETVSTGTVNQCVIYPREIIAHALRAGASSMIIAHNHPAGIMQPSEADWDITRRMFDICRLLDLPLVDHVIVGRNRTLSLRELPRWPR